MGKELAKQTKKYHIKRDGGLLCSTVNSKKILVTNMYFVKNADPEIFCKKCLKKYSQITKHNEN